MKGFCFLNSFLTVKDFILKKKLIKEGDRIIAAVSGGADSVFLLYALICLKRDLRFGLSICHFNHRLREEANEEEEFVKSLANRFSLPFFSERGNVKDYARKNGISIEMAARRLRYAFFERLVNENRGNLIALAHNLTDSIETFFLNIDRGSGIRGLKGISPKNSFIVRPILCLTKDEIRQSLNKFGIKYKLDSSNLDLSFKRNKVRKVLINGLHRVFGRSMEGRFAVLFENIDNSLNAISFFVENSLKGNGFIDKFGARIKLDYLKSLPDYAFYELILFVFERLTGSTYRISTRLLKDLRDFIFIHKSASRNLFSDKSIVCAKTKSCFYLVKNDFFKRIEFNYPFENEIKLPLGYRLVFEKCSEFVLSSENEFIIANKSLLNSSVKVERIDFEMDYMITKGKMVNDLNNFLKKNGLSKFERNSIFVLKKGNEVLYIPFLRVSDKLKKVKQGEDLIKVYIKDCLR